MKSDKSRSVGVFGAIAIGIGGMVGGGIFAVLGEAVSLADGATYVAFFLAGIVALFTAYSYTKLSVAYQNRGGTVVFIDNAFNHNLLSGSVNLMLWLSYLVTISLYATAFASYGATFFSDASYIKEVLIFVAIFLPTWINLISASFVSKSESIIVLIKVTLLILIIVSGVSYIEPSRLSVEHWESPISIVTAGMIIFVAYEGFELISNAAEDIKNPEKNLPKAFYGSVLFVVALYVLISIVTVGVVPVNQLLEAKDYALAIAAKPALGQVGFTIVAIAALLSTFSAINATIYGNARLGFFLAKEGVLPKVLSKEKKDIPNVGVVVTSLLSIVLASTIPLADIAIIGSAGFLLIFTIVNISAFKLSKKIGANKVLLSVAILLSLLALITLLYHTYTSNPRAVFVFFVFIAISVIFESLYGRGVRGHFLKRTYDISSPK
jgi:amino acid transporter